ncbi:MAG: hypothetical protein KDD48_04510, partial [Bdellovibrionales bacterium]|nr:hypothetical protein [Bdellovibrionales bacterium]
PSASEAAKVNTPDVSPEKFIKNEWQICPVCESTDAFLCKAIPRKLFLSILIPMLIVAFVLLLKNWWWGFGFLVILLAIDLMLYRWLPNMLVCYGCQSEFRGFKIKDGLSFDHHVAERYRQRQAQ